MKKCLSCGGALRSLNNGTHKCSFCSCVFSDAELQAAAEAKAAATAATRRPSAAEEAAQRAAAEEAARRAVAAAEAAAAAAAKAAQRASAPVAAVPRSNEGVDVFEKNKNGAIEFTCRYPGCQSAGSGLLIDDQGYALTNTHVVTHDCKPCDDITVRLAGESVRARIIALGDNEGGSGKGVDIALVKLDRVPANATVIELGNFDDVRIGEQVYVIGNSLGDGTCITSGIVSDKQRVLNGHTLMMTDCAINGGNSGGPIFNAQGIAIGVIVSSRLNRDGTATKGMNYAIPMNIVKQFLTTCYNGKV